MTKIQFGERIVHTKYHNGVSSTVETESIRVKVDDMDDLKHEIDLALKEIKLHKRNMQLQIEINRNTGEPRFVIKTTIVN